MFGTLAVWYTLLAFIHTFAWMLVISLSEQLLNPLRPLGAKFFASNLQLGGRCL